MGGASSSRMPAAGGGDARHAGRSVAVIALSVGLASFAMNGWFPFLPLYMQHLGVESEARALFWVAVAMTVTGLSRLAGGPFWGALSDRYGRKPMYVRTLLFATITSLIVAFAAAPWQVALGLACQGFFSGFVPASVALTSVIVPQSRLTSALGQVQGAQYAGNTLGPAIGAALATAFGLRGAILISAAVPAVAGLIVLLAVPRDSTPTLARPVPAGGGPGTSLPPAGAAAPTFGLQFALGVFLIFMVWVMNQVVRISAPVAISGITGAGAATGATGVAFTVAGLASVAGALGLTRLTSRPGQVRLSLTLLIAVAAAAQVALGLAASVLVFTLAFAVVSLAQGAMVPAVNAIIATSVPPERRGTAFGLASGAQAASFMVGPMSAAFFAAVSLGLGYVLLGALLAATGAVTLLLLREPDLGGRVRPAAQTDGGERAGSGATA